ncbi:MAG: phytanoyl-CoA dioxygenase family protein [Gammaproteobacteria bacterium]
MLSSSDQKLFQEQGFAVIDDAFAKEDLFNFKVALQQIIRIFIKRAREKYSEFPDIVSGSECDQGIIALKYAAPEYLSYVQRAISRTPEYFRLISYPHIPQMLNALLGETESPIYFSNNGVLFTQPYSQYDKRSINIELDWHNDIFYTIPRSKFLQIWAPLIHDSTEEIGTLMVCPGSHKEGLMEHQVDIDAPYNHRYAVPAALVEKFEKKSIELRLGQILVFDNHLLHRSGRNTSKLVRCSMVGLCHNIANSHFTPFAFEYKYSGQTPEAYHYECFGDKKILPIINEQAESQGEPKGGV